MPKVARDTAVFYKGYSYSFMTWLSKFGKPTKQNTKPMIWARPSRKKIYKWHAQRRKRRLQYNVANAVLQKCLKSSLRVSPCMIPNAIQIKKLPTARNLSKSGRRIVEAVSTDTVPNNFLPNLKKILNCWDSRYQIIPCIGLSKFKVAV